MAQAVVPMMVASSVASGISSLQQGNSEYSQRMGQAHAIRTQGLEQEVSLRDQLKASLSGVAAAHGANGLSRSSPTRMAIDDDIRKYARQDITSLRANTEARASGAQIAARTARLKGRMGFLSSMFDAAKAAAPRA